MGCTSKFRRAPRRATAPVFVGDFSIPDPRTWPAAVKERFRELTAGSGPLDVFIFVSGSLASMYLQDAVTALGTLNVNPSDWHVEDGYPAFHFDANRIDDYGRRLAASGYAVRLVEMAQKGSRKNRAAVIDIGAIRQGRKRS